MQTLSPMWQLFLPKLPRLSFFKDHFQVKIVRPRFMFCFSTTRIHANKYLTAGVRICCYIAFWMIEKLWFLEQGALDITWILMFLLFTGTACCNALQVGVVYGKNLDFLAVSFSLHLRGSVSKSPKQGQKGWKLPVLHLPHN